MAHKLNHCGTARGDVYRQGLGEFFLDDLHEYQAGVVVLRPDVQARLLPTLQDNTQLARLHTARYSMVAYPWAQTYQQSNQWALETLAFAMAPEAATRERAQAWLQLHGYQPTTLRISPFKQAGRACGHRPCRVRRPPERQTIRRSHRNRHGRLCVRVVESQRPGRPVQVLR